MILECINLRIYQPFYHILCGVCVCAHTHVHIRTYSLKYYQLVDFHSNAKYN